MKLHHSLILLFNLAFYLPSLAASNPPGLVVAWGDVIAMRSQGPPPEFAYATEGVAIAGEPFTNATSVSAGIFHSVALRRDGTAVGWGNNVRSQAVGFPTPGIEATNGVVVINGRALTNVISVAAGANFSLALRTDGTVAAWGSSKMGECNVPSGLSNVIGISAGEFHSLALKSDGTVATWGGRKSIFSGVSNIVQVSASRSWWHDAVILRDGTVLEQLSDGEIRIPLSGSNFVAVTSGYNHGLALTRDGAVYGWGYNSGGQATGVPTWAGSRQSSGIVVIDGSPLTNAIAISAGQEYSLALKIDGTVVAWGNKRFYRDVPANLKGVVAISAGDGFCLAITTNYVAVPSSK
jgi:alpha-tubulin suppressor-like RCC1 family protein